MFVATTNVKTADPEVSGAVYAKVFGLQPLTGLGHFHDSVLEWTAWELNALDGTITVRFVKNGGGVEGWSEPDFVRLVSANLEETCERAVMAGFRVVSAIEPIDEKLSIVRMLDPEGNRLVVGNGNLWVRPAEGVRPL